MGRNAHHDGLKSLNHNMKAASIVNEAYCISLIETIKNIVDHFKLY